MQLARKLWVLFNTGLGVVAKKIDRVNAVLDGGWRFDEHSAYPCIQMVCSRILPVPIIYRRFP